MGLEKVSDSERLPEVQRLVREALAAFGEKTLLFSGMNAGPAVTIIGGMHGNEILGVLAADMLRRELESGETRLMSGRVRLLLGNTRAIEVNERVVPGGNDMNRLFGYPSLLPSSALYDWESRRVQAIADAIAPADITIDLHSTNRPSPAFVCSSSSEAHQSVYKWLPKEAVVIDPDRIISGGGGSVDEFADDCGGVGICYEAGVATDTQNLIPVVRALKAILIERGVIEGEMPAIPTTAPEYVVTSSVPYDPNEAFIFAEGKARGFAPITRGEVIGYRGAEAVLSPIDGVILFPKKPEHQASAGAVCYLAQELGS